MLEQAKEWERNSANPEGFEKFLELTKTLVLTYEMAGADERRTFVEMTTSNRTVIGKKVDLEPSKWLTDIRQNVDVLFSGPDRGTDRTFERILGFASEGRMTGLKLPRRSQ